MDADGVHERDHPVWRLTLVDLGPHDGAWSWEADAAALQKIVSFLQEMERLTWTEVRAQLTGGWQRRGPAHKPVPVEHLCPAAQQRLARLGLDDVDELFRFRLGNFERLWGVVHDGVFYPVWWDPGHQVCP